MSQQEPKGRGAKGLKTGTRGTKWPRDQRAKGLKREGNKGPGTKGPMGPKEPMDQTFCA